MILLPLVRASVGFAARSVYSCRGMRSGSDVVPCHGVIWKGCPLLGYTRRIVDLLLVVVGSVGTALLLVSKT